MNKTLLIKILLGIVKLIHNEILVLRIMNQNSSKYFLEDQSIHIPTMLTTT